MLRNLSLKGNLFIVATWGNINRSLDWRALSSRVWSGWDSSRLCWGNGEFAAQIPLELGKLIKRKVVSALRYNAIYVFRWLCPLPSSPTPFLVFNEQVLHFEQNHRHSPFLFCFFWWEVWLIKYFNPCYWASLKWRLFPGSVFDLRTLHPASALSIEEQHILSWWN